MSIIAKMSNPFFFSKKSNGNKFRIELSRTFNLALPIIISQLGVILMAVADNVIVGRLLGGIHLGAAGIANSIAFLISSFAIGGMAVIAPMVSKYLAEKDQKRLVLLFSNTIFSAVILSLILAVAGWLLWYNFELLNQKPVVNELALPFFLLIMVSNLPLIFFLALKQFSDGYSKPKVVMLITFIGLIFNVPANILLIKGWGIFPSLGLNGAAYATVAARVLMLLLLWLYLRYSHSFSYLFNLKKWNFSRSFTLELFRKIIPSGFQTFFEIAAFTFAVVMMGWISETDLAAHQIAINVASVTYMMATGFAHAGGIRIGDAWGSKDGEGISIAGNAAYLWVVAFMSFCTIIILLFGQHIIKIYIEDHLVLATALPLLTIAAFFQLSDGIQSVGLGVLRGLGDVKIPTYITFVAYWVLALPIGYYLAFKHDFGGVGIWIGLLIGLTFSGIFLFIRFRNVSRKRIEKLETV